MSTFQRSVLLPSGHTGIDAMNLAVCLKSLAGRLEKLGNTKVTGIRIDPKERKIIVTLAGEDTEAIRRQAIAKELAELNGKKGKR